MRWRETIRSGRLTGAALLCGAILLATTGCQAQRASTLPAAPVGQALQPAAPLVLPASAFAPPPDLVFVIPAGTFAAEMRGEPAFTLPSDLRVATGQSITVRNDDQAMHYFFDLPIAPGQTVRKTFSQPGRFGYSPGLSCSLAPGGGVKVEVGEAGP